MNPYKSIFFLLVLAVQLFMMTNSWCYKGSFAENDSINQLDISSDGIMVLTASESDKLTIWNVTKMQPMGVYTIGRPVKTAKFSKDQSMIAVGFDQSAVHIISGTTFLYQRTINTNHSQVNQVDFSQDNSKLLTCGNKVLNVFYLANSSYTALTQPSSGNFLWACKFAKDGQFATVDASGNVYMYRSSISHRWTQNTGGKAFDLDFNPNSNSFIVGNDNQKVYSYRTSTNNPQ